MPPRPEGTRRRPRPIEHRHGQLVVRVLTHNITIMMAIAAALLALLFNVNLGENKPPKAAQNMSANEVAAMFERSEMTPAVAAGVANAKRRAYLAEKRKGKSKGGNAATADEATQGFKTTGGGGGDTSLTQNQAIGRDLNAAKGWANCWSSLKSLWIKESQWNERAQNPSSGAYGIPQSLPGDKMASVDSDWRTNARTQIVWGLQYICARYGTPCKAWAHSQSVGWY
jgi:hypothetical protein